MIAAERPCPDCGAALKLRAKSCACGWKAPVVTTGGVAAPAVGYERDRYRCAWTADGKQCRNPGSCSRGTLGSGTLYCFGHLACADTGDAELGKRIVDASAETIPENGDYSAAGMVAAARVAHRIAVEKNAGRPVPNPEGVRRPLANDRHLRRVAAIGAAAFTGSDAPVDRELLAEREAMQFEGQS